MFFGPKKFHTVKDIPEKDFEKHKIIFAKVEELVTGSSGDLLRVRHVPGYAIGHQTPTTKIVGDFESETLLVRLHGLDTEDNPESIQDEGLELIGNLVYHKMVEITLMHRDQPVEGGLKDASAVAIVKTIEQHLAMKRDQPQPKDLSHILAKAGLAKTTMAYSMEEARRNLLEEAVHHATLNRVGLFAKKTHDSHSLQHAHAAHHHHHHHHNNNKHHITTNGHNHEVKS